MKRKRFKDKMKKIGTFQWDPEKRGTKLNVDQQDLNDDQPIKPSEANSEAKESPIQESKSQTNSRAKRKGKKSHIKELESNNQTNSVDKKKRKESNIKDLESSNQTYSGVKRKGKESHIKELESKKQTKKVGKRKRTEEEEEVERWQLTVAKRLRLAQERRLKGHDEQSYGWFKFIRDLLNENNQIVSFKILKKEAIEFYDSNKIYEELTKKEFFKYLFSKMDAHPKFNVDMVNSCVSWVESWVKRSTSVDS